MQHVFSIIFTFNIQYHFTMNFTDLTYEIQDHTEEQQKYNKNMNKYPQVGKTVHGSCPQVV